MAKAAIKVRRGRPKLSAEGLDLERLRPAADVPMYDQVYAELCRSIMAGAVKPEQQLSVRSLADRLGTSVTPVKEAMRRLRADGVLFAAAKSAFKVTEMTVERYCELLEIRKRLEGYAAEEACLRATPQLIATLTRLNGEMRAMPLSPNYLKHNLDFHFALYEAAAKPDLMDIIRGLWLRVGPYLSYYDQFDGTASYRTHASIIAALRKRDPAAARAAVCHDLDDAAEVIMRKILASGAKLRPAPSALQLRLVRPTQD